MGGYFDTEGIERTGDIGAGRGRELRSFAIAEGITLTPVLGKALNLNVVILEPNAVAPVHVHAEEQLGYVVSGTITWHDDDRSWTLEPGDVYHAPSGAPHGAVAGPEGCVVIDVFSPPRSGIKEMLDGSP